MNFCGCSYCTATLTALDEIAFAVAGELGFIVMLVAAHGPPPKEHKSGSCSVLVSC